jgi:hypothetical protein
MFGRREFGLLGLSAAAVAALESTGFGADAHVHDAGFDKCADACSDCQRACDSCAHHCAMMLAEGKKEHLMTLQTCQDCADICAAASQIVSRGGPFADLICMGCADACARCGKQCEQHAGDKHMTRCAEECRKCETACREMLKK